MVVVTVQSQFNGANKETNYTNKLTPEFTVFKFRIVSRRISFPLISIYDNNTVEIS